MLKITPSHTCEVMSLEVRLDNVVAQHVYQNLGFEYGGKRKIIMVKVRMH